MAFLSTRSVRAARPSTGGKPVYAIGDIHGRYDLLKRMLALISADRAASRFAEPPIIVFLGDYVDRGPESARVLEALRWIKASPRFESHLLKGNHEQSLLRFMEGDAHAGAWLSWGGDFTLAAYGVPSSYAVIGPEQLEEMRARLLQAMPASHLDLLLGLEMMVTVGDYAFVHAGVRPHVPLERQGADDMLWIREEFMHSREDFGKIIVHGHTWLGDAVQVLPNRVGIDTGAYETGVLTAVRLHNEEMSFLRATCD